MFINKWEQVVSKKDSILCVGLDPAEKAQSNQSFPSSYDKFSWCMKMIEEISPHTAAVKINRNYIKDFSREETKQIVDFIHLCGMLAIDDSKLCDIGSTNESGFYHANQEGFDCITYCPYPGNVSEAIQQAHKYDLGIVAVTLMSNPEFQNVKNTLYGEDLFFRALSKQSIELGADGIVIGAPSPSNHITEDEISELSKFMSNNVVLVPGIGSQGGNAESIIRIFQRNAILNVGRDIIYDPSPSERAEFYKNSFNEVLV